MSKITVVMLTVILVETFSVDGQSTFDSCERNDQNVEDEIFDEIRHIKNQLSACNQNCCEIKDIMVRYFNNIQNVNIAGQENRVPVTWPRDCADIAEVGQSVSDVYEVFVLGPDSVPVEISVYCDMNSTNSSWLVFQRRMDDSENFERTWIEYSNGFGNLRGEFWLGNKALHLLTSNRNHRLRVELEDFEGNKRYAEFKTFTVASASDNYRLNITGYSGDAGNSMAGNNGQMFTTFDADHDNSPTEQCAQKYHGAWWYNRCHSSNLNGRYLRGNHTTYANGVNWESFRGYYYSLKHVEMKIAPA